MLDFDLAKIYGVSTRRLNQQTRRNIARFPADFLIQLTDDEVKNLMLQNATSSRGHGGRRKPPLAFTEHGAVMLAAVLNSPIAVAASIQIVRAFNRLRQIALVHKDMALALAKLARTVAGHDEQFKIVFDAIQKLMEPPLPPRKQIGFEPPAH